MASSSSRPKSFSSQSTVLRLQEELRSSKQELSKVLAEIKQLHSRKDDLEKKVTDLKSELDLLNESESSISQFDRDDFPWSSEMTQNLKAVFKIQSFRSHQKAALNATMTGIDLMLIMPTGGGKSLCFQLPAVLSPGVTLVVSPLISLMEDQLQGLQALNISTAIFNSQTDKDETKRIFEAMLDPKSNMKMLYVTPEKLAKSKRLMAQLEKMYRVRRFARLVIDEVHCCSQWGHDFRPDYKFLGIMKTQYPLTPIIGLTATATANVIVDIQKILNIEGCLVLRDSFYRHNLKYIVIDSPTKDKVNEIAELIKSRFPSESGIIYCLTIKDCEDMSVKLQSLGIRCDRYHAQLEPAERTKIQHKWSKNTLQVIVATVAFGMGINKLDVRFVIHHSMSKSVENYYQETGRAGRDGLPAECILFYSFQDAFRASTLMFTERNGIRNVYNMLRYALDQVGCRKQFIAQHFGDSCDIVKDGCSMCDNCDIKSDGVDAGNKEKSNNSSRKETKVDAAALLMDVLKILDHASRLDERMTALKLMDALFSKGNKNLRVDDVPVPNHEREICEKVLGLLLIDGYLLEDFHFTPYSTISYIVPGGNKVSILGQQGDLFYTFYSKSTYSNSSAKNFNKNNKRKTEAVKKNQPSSSSTASATANNRTKAQMKDFDEDTSSAKKRKRNNNIISNSNSNSTIGVKNVDVDVILEDSGSKDFIQLD